MSNAEKDEEIAIQDQNELDYSHDTLSSGKNELAANESTVAAMNDEKTRTGNDIVEEDETQPPILEEKSSVFNTIWNNLRALDSIASDPREFSRLKKRLILATVAIGTSISPMSSTIFLPVIVQMQMYFNTSATTMNSALTSFVFASGIFPLLWAPAGEQFGRRKLYLFTFLFSAIGTLICGFSINAGMFIAFRFISAAGSSSVMSMGAGTIADIYDAHERGTAMAFYTAGPLLGPALGPIIGGYLGNAFGWQSDFYFVAAYTLAIWICFVFTLPETWRPLPGLTKEDKKPSTFLQKFKKIDVLRTFRFFKNINIFLASFFTGVSFMMFYMLNTTFSRTYAIQYHLSSGTVGLCYLPLAAGGLVGSTIGGRLADVIYNKRAAAVKEEDVYPEMRLSLEVIGLGTFLQIAGMIAYGWCIQYNVHMAAGLVSMFIVACGMVIPIVSISTYCIDCFRRESAEVTAFNNLIRYIMAGIGALISTDMEDALGPGVTYSVCAGICVVFFALVILVQKNPKMWR